jgi:cell division transport system ATP-binding protein
MARIDDMHDDPGSSRPSFTLVKVPDEAAAEESVAPMFSEPVQDGKRRKGDIFRPGPGPMVELRGVTKTYDGDNRGLDGVSLRINTGEFVFLVGPSGSGKSTFIRLIIRELRPTAGSVVVGGRDLGELRRSKIPYLRRAIGCVFQDFRLLPDRTAAENVAYALQVTGHSAKEVRRRVPEILSLVGLDDKFDRLPRELSGGEQQRVSIARALVNHPRLLIADEPTGNLDPDTSFEIMDLLTRIHRTGTTVLVATHDQHTVDRMQMRVIALEDGRLVRDEESAGYHETTGEVHA